MIGVMILIFWLFVIRPQSKMAKQRNAMLDALKAGDKIETVSRVFAEVVNVNGEKLTINVGTERNRVEIVIHKEGVARLISDENKDSDKKN